MTVLSEYQRLESVGLWRSTPEDQRRDVVVSVGDATLVITDMNDRALAHWSLPAVERQNPGTRPAIYAPGADAPESLEIADEAMVEAIEKVRKAISRSRHQPGRLRTGLVVAGTIIFLFLTLFWLPGAIIRYTASIVPDATRAALGRDLLSHIRRVAGAPCAAPAGLRALSGLEARLFPSIQGHLTVIPSGLAETAHLPGGTILIGRSLVEDHETPDVLAGYLLAENLRRTSKDPVIRLLFEAGIGASLKLLTTGSVPDTALKRHAETLMAAQSEDVPDMALINAFKSTDIAASPYAFARDISGETTVTLIESDALTDRHEGLLSDGNWIALQRICED